MTKQDAIKILTDGEWWDYLGDACPDIYNLSDAIDCAIDAMHERDTLKAEIEQLKRERDAAVRLLPRECSTCSHWHPKTNKPFHLPKGRCSWHGREGWQWRGVKEGAGLRRARKMRLIDENKLDFSECVLFARGGTIYADFGAIMKKIGEAPTIDPESLRPVGHWECKAEPFYICSNCNQEAEMFACDDMMDYCPRCGARMEVQQNG